MITLNNVNLGSIRKQIIEDFPMISVHPASSKTMDRHNFLVHLAVYDYIDLMITEWEHRQRHIFATDCENWSLGDMDYDALLSEAKKIITEQATRNTIIVKQVTDVYKQEASSHKRFSLKSILKHIKDCFYVALWSDVYEDFK